MSETWKALNSSKLWQMLSQWYLQQICFIEVYHNSEELVSSPAILPHSIIAPLSACDSYPG